MAYYLGLDNGGTVTKAAIFDSTGRSLATFKRDFAKVSDLTPQKWIIRRRLEAAHELIVSGKRKISFDKSNK